MNSKHIKDTFLELWSVKQKATNNNENWYHTRTNHSIYDIKYAIIYIINGKIRILIFLIDIDAKSVLFPCNSCKSIHYYLNPDKPTKAWSILY